MGVVAKLKWCGLVVVAACIPPVPPLPSHGGPTWVEVASEHFVLWTDAPVRRGRELVREMEARRLRDLGATPTTTAPAAKAFAVAFQDAEQVRVYAPFPTVALSWDRPMGALLPAGIVFGATVRGSWVVPHHINHVIASEAGLHQPRWLNEGIASYYDTARFDAATSTVGLGESPDRWLQRWGWTPMPSAQLFYCSTCWGDFSKTSWALFSYLLDEHPEELRHYMRRLGELPRAEEKRAWDESFHLSTEELDADLATWLESGKLTVRHYKVAVPTWPVTERALGDADVLAARGMLRLVVAKQPSEARAEVAAALAADRTNLLARLVMTSIAKSIDPDDARATAAMNADDWRAWWLVWFAIKRGPEARAAYFKACSLAPDQSDLCGPGPHAPRLPD